jgi:hypothetical protein
MNQKAALRLIFKRRESAKKIFCSETDSLNAARRYWSGGPSGIGKSSIAMQMGCLWACGKEAFDIQAARALRIVMVQNEDSHNDLVRQSEVLKSLNLSPQEVEKVRANFWIGTLRGKIGPDAIKVMEQLVNWHKAVGRSGQSGCADQGASGGCPAKDPSRSGARACPARRPPSPRREFSRAEARASLRRCSPTQSQTLAKEGKPTLLVGIPA